MSSIADWLPSKWLPLGEAAERAAYPYARNRFPPVSFCPGCSHPVAEAHWYECPVRVRADAERLVRQHGAGARDKAAEFALMGSDVFGVIRRHFRLVVDEVEYQQQFPREVFDYPDTEFVAPTGSRFSRHTEVQESDDAWL